MHRIIKNFKCGLFPSIRDYKSSKLFYIKKTRCLKLKVKNKFVKISCSESKESSNYSLYFSKNTNPIPKTWVPEKQDWMPFKLSWNLTPFSFKILGVQFTRTMWLNMHNWKRCIMYPLNKLTYFSIFCRASEKRTAGRENELKFFNTILINYKKIEI